MTLTSFFLSLFLSREALRGHWAGTFWLSSVHRVDAVRADRFVESWLLWAIEQTVAPRCVFRVQPLAVQRDVPADTANRQHTAGARSVTMKQED